MQRKEKIGNIYTNYKPYKYADDMPMDALLWKDCIDY